MTANEKNEIDLKRLLNNDLEDLKYLYTFPNLYLYDYFSELRRRVDLAAAEKLLNDSENSKLVDNYISLIDRINLFEHDCTHRLQKNEFDSDLKANAARLTKSIEYELISQLNIEKATVNSYREMVYDEAFKLKKILLQNQTIEFIEVKESLVRNLFSKMDMNVTIGKLIIVKNQSFDKRGLSLITKYFVCFYYL